MKIKMNEIIGTVRERERERELFFNKIKNEIGITLVALVVTIIILLILSGITILQLTGNGLFTKTKTAKEEANKSQAVEKMNLKITTVQIGYYSEKQELPGLQYLADRLCEDNDMQYVLTASKLHGSLEKIDVSKATSIYTKLKDYPYEFEINNSLQLASIDGVSVATNSGNGNTGNSDYNPNIYDEWTTWLKIAGISNPEQYNKVNIVENKTLMDEILNNDNAIDYMINSKCFIMPAIINSEIACKYIIENEKALSKVTLDSVWYEKFENMLNKVNVPVSTEITSNMICSSTYSKNSILNVYDGKIPSTGWSDSWIWMPTAKELDSFIGYDFKELTKLYKLSITYGCYSNFSNLEYSFIIQGLNSDGTWENIGSEKVVKFTNNQKFETVDFSIDTNNKYYGYRIKNNNSSSSNGKTYWFDGNTEAFGIGELQFYCIK